MPRFDNLSLAELEMIRRFVDQSQNIEIIPRRELHDDLCALVEKHWPHLLHKLPPHTRISASSK